MSDNSATFVRADTPLQREMAKAIIALVATVECESAARGDKPNGIYRLKLSGGVLTLSFEKFYASAPTGAERRSAARYEVLESE